jgi:hypothetical protein
MAFDSDDARRRSESGRWGGPPNRFTEAQLRRIQETPRAEVSSREWADEFGVSVDYIRDIRSGRRGVRGRRGRYSEKPRGVSPPCGRDENDHDQSADGQPTCPGDADPRE